MKEKFRLWLLHTFFGKVTKSACWRCYYCLWLNNFDENQSLESHRCEKCELQAAVSCDSHGYDQDEIEEAIKAGKL